MRSSSDFDHIWMPFTAYQDTVDFPPRIITSGQGIYVRDDQGHTLIDAVGSWWVSSFGHRHPAIVAALREQLDNIEHILMAGYISTPALRLSHRLAKLLPAPLTRVFFSDDGSTAVEVALKIALQYHALRKSGACEFVGLGGAYHGDTLGAMSVSGIPSYHAIFHERFKKQHTVRSPYCYRCPAGKDPAMCGAECMDGLEALLRDRHGNIAACVFEPMVQGAAGMRIYPAKVLKRIFELCRRHTVLTIADEVATGFGRTGTLFACEHAAEAPDIMCLAKGLTGGFIPMGVTAVQEHIFEEFKGDFMSGRTLHHGHSFTGNPLAAAAACATMDLISRHDIPASLAPVIRNLSTELAALREYDVVGDVRSIGMIGAVEFVHNRTTKEPFPPSQRFAFTVARRAFDHGLLIRPLGDVLYFFPAFIITPGEVSELFSRFRAALEEAIRARTAS
ncbi:MAG: adenosylmethionine--8-amino-7-oxononanoate transaminase [Chitinispirillaceae bacterium]|nr:adenosylmethionine--8-amino-7-oxononanoate transaminase [Chitinispirillaceae bacterium]